MIFLTLSGGFVQSNSEGNLPCILTSQHRVDAETIADEFLTAGWSEVVLAEKGQ